MCLSTETHRELGFVSHVDGNVVTRSWQEPNPVCPLGAKCQYSLIQGSWWPYCPYLLQIRRIDCKVSVLLPFGFLANAQGVCVARVTRDLSADSWVKGLAQLLHSPQRL